MMSRKLNCIRMNIRWLTAVSSDEFVHRIGETTKQKNIPLSSLLPKDVIPKLSFRRYSTVRNYSQNSCPNCGHSSVSSFKCLQCEALIVPPKETTLFEVLNQQVSFDLKEPELKKIHRKLQTEFHPDKYSQKDPQERVKSEEISSLINKAYFTLSNPYERGMYLLQLMKHPINESDIQLGTEFLAQIMENNEELESISSKEELERFEQSNETEIKKLSSLLSEAFVTNNLESAKANLNKMKYFISIRNRLKEMERNMS